MEDKKVIVSDNGKTINDFLDSVPFCQRQYKNIIIHHSATPDGLVNDWDGIRKYHMSYRYNGNIITKEEADKLRLMSKKQADKFSWEKSAKVTLKVFEEVGNK